MSPLRLETVFARDSLRRMISLHNPPLLPALAGLALLACACGDSTTSASDSDSASTSETSDATTSGDATESTTAGTDGSTTGVGTSAGTTGDTAETDAPTTDATTDASGTTDATGATDATTDATDATDTDTGDQPVCEGEGELPAEWYINVIDGVFPGDVPESLDEGCTVVAGAGLRLDCPSLEFELTVTATPMPTLPEPGAQAHVRLHHEPGWLNWPDLWIDVDVEGGDQLSFQASSVLLPTQGDYATPWSPSLTQSQCGPFLLMDMIGQDNCGEQLGYELRFNIDGEGVTAWHGTHTLADVGGGEFEAWIGASREYLDPPEFCDTSPRWFWFMTRRG